MVMVLDFPKLYAPYSRDASLETTMLYFEREAQSFGIPSDIRDWIVAEVFIEMADGKEFSIDSCSCSPHCVFNTRVWSSADMNHYVLKKLIAKSDELKLTRAQGIMENINTAILSHMKNDNDTFVRESFKQSWLTDWNNSEILNALKRLVSFRKSWVVRGIKWIGGRL